MLLALSSCQIPQLIDSLSIIEPLVRPVVELLHRYVISAGVLVGSRTGSAEERVHGSFKRSRRRADLEHRSGDTTEESSVVRLKIGSDKSWVERVCCYSVRLVAIIYRFSGNDAGLLAVAVSPPVIV